MNENAFYYTMSTIAQTEASLIGLLITITFFMVQSIETKIKDALIKRSSEQIMGEEREEVLSLIRSKNFEWANDFINVNKHSHEQINTWIKQYRFIKRMIFAPIIIGFLPIGFAICSLALSDLIVKTEFRNISLILCVTFFFVSIFLMVSDLKKTFDLD